MVVVTICYRKGVDLDYYVTRHIPASKEIMIPLGLLKGETRRIYAAHDGSAPAYEVITSLYFESIESLQRCMSHPDMAKLSNDAPNFYAGGMPEIYVGEVIGDLLDKK